MVRVALFGSFYRGYYVLKELLYGKQRERFTVVGVATDDPSKSFVSPKKRLWQYPHSDGERTLVRREAERHGLEVYDGRVKSEHFYDIYENSWKPDLCLMATFGQLINRRLFEYPSMGFYNLHPSSDAKWPSYVGGNPFQAMINDGREYAVITMHEVDEQLDHGDFVACSPPIFFPENTNVVELHKITSPFAAKLAVEQIDKILRSNNFAV